MMLISVFVLIVVDVLALTLVSMLLLVALVVLGYVLLVVRCRCYVGAYGDACVGCDVDGCDYVVCVAGVGVGSCVVFVVFVLV